MKLTLEQIANGKDSIEVVRNIARDSLAKQEQGEPVAITTGTYGGRFTYVTNKPNVILPDGMALFATPQQPIIDKSSAIRIATALGWTPPKQEQSVSVGEPVAYCNETAIDRLREEPGDWMLIYGKPQHPHKVPLYAAPQQRTWVELTFDEIDEGLLRSDYALQTAHAWRAGVVFAMSKLKEKNSA